MQPVPAAADVCQDEGDIGMTSREGAELNGVRRFLPRPVAPAVLPDVLEHGHATLAREHANRIEQQIVRPSARRQLDADHTRIEAAHDFRPRVRHVVRVDAYVAADRIGMFALQREERVVSCRDVAGGREINRRCEAPTAQDRCYVRRDADAFPGPETALVPLVPIRAWRFGMVEMGMGVHKHCFKV